MIISLDKYKATGGGTKVEGDIAISENGIYDVTTYATANVYVQPSDNYSYFDGGVDVEGLRAIGWDDESIGMFRDNNPHYSWQNSDYIVSEENKALYGVIVDKSSIQNNKDNPNFKYCPLYSTRTTSMEELFKNCSFLIGVPRLNTSNVTSMARMFQYCPSLTSIPQLDTSNVTTMGAMFHECPSLTSIPQLNTSNVTTMGAMFTKCSSLISIPQLDTSKVTNMEGMFSGCSSLTSIPQLDTSNVMEMNSMFSNCSSLTSIPQLDTSNVTTINYMFYGCKNLNEVPNLNLSKIKNFGTASYDATFYNVEKLISIGELQCDSLINISYFLYSSNSKLTNFGGIKNLGMQPTLTGANGTYFMIKMPNLTHESILNVLNGLYDRASAGYSTLTLKMHANHMALLSEEDISIATSKGWTLSA